MEKNKVGFTFQTNEGFSLSVIATFQFNALFECVAEIDQGGELYPFTSRLTDDELERITARAWGEYKEVFV